MISKIQLQKNAVVMAADGKHLGSLKRVVVHSRSNVITDIVVRTGSLFNQEEKVIPIGLVAETAESRILLHEQAGDLEFLLPFEERRLVAEKVKRGRSSNPGNFSPATGEYASIGLPVMQSPNERILNHFEQNIPDGTVAMKEGANVITADGENVGKVVRVLAEPEADQITHLLVSKGLFAREAKLIPAKWVMVMGEDKVRLRVKKDSVDELTDAPLAV